MLLYTLHKKYILKKHITLLKVSDLPSKLHHKGQIVQYSHTKQQRLENSKNSFMSSCNPSDLSEGPAPQAATTVKCCSRTDASGFTV